MSEVTAVPLRPIKKGALVILWAGLALVAATGVALAFKGTSQHVVATTASGLKYQVLEEGSGPKPKSSDMVLVEYDGKLANGETFDSSARHGGPAPLPVEGLIPGFTEALKLMSPGAHYRFWIPPQLAYGARGAGDGVIPPNALLIFDIHLLAVQPQQPGMGGIGGPNGG